MAHPSRHQRQANTCPTSSSKGNWKSYQPGAAVTLDCDVSGLVHSEEMVADSC